MPSTLFHQELNRLNMGELLHPEPDYQLEFAVGLTYSMDLEALLGIPVSLGMMDDLDSDHMKNPFFLLEALRKSSDKIAVFCNRGSIKVPKEYRDVFTLLGQSIFEVGIEKGSFHPKVWFVKYTNNDNASYYKVITLSRNLTFDRSLDVAVELTGHVGTDINETNRPLSEILLFVAQKAEPTKRLKIKAMAEEIMKVTAFEGLDQIDKVIFHHFKVSSTSTKPMALFADALSLIIVSPFLTESIIKQITEKPNDTCLITRKSSITKGVFESVDDVYIVKDGVIDDDVLEEDAIENLPKRDIHAKIFFKGSYEGNFLYFGSLNATYKAFHDNVEFLVGLKLKPRFRSYYSIKDELVNTDPCPFEKLDDFDASLTPENEDSVSSLDDVLLALETAEVIKIDDKYRIQINCKNLINPASIRPITNPRAFVPLLENTFLDNLRLMDLTEFYVVRRDKEDVVVKITTKGIPVDERDNQIYRSVINNKGGFLAYVSFMLTDNYAEVIYEQDAFYESQRLLGKQGINQIPSALYERLLKAVISDPAKITDIETVMNRLEPSGVSDDFKAMLALFKSVAKKVRK